MMRASYKLIFVFQVIAFLFLSSCSQTNTLVLVKDGASDYQLVISDTANQQLLDAAKLLTDYIHKVSGCKMPVVTDASQPKENEILFGKSTRVSGLKDFEWKDTLGNDGFIIKTFGKKLLIAGSTAQGTQNAVYSFIESYLGCRLYAPDAEQIPTTKTIKLAQLSRIEKPFFTFREVHGYAPHDTLYRNWHKLHLKGVNSPAWGMFVHTFNKLLPPDSLFASHPEYYSQVGGIRVADGQLCLSNPQVYELVEQNLQKMMETNPQAQIWSVSQNDTYKNCECANCRHLDSLYGGPSGTLIWFVNQLAEQFPQKTISTLAYQYTRSAPKNIQPLPNVNIMLCTIECDRNKTVEEDQGFKNDIEGWGKLTHNIFLWDYVVQFRNYLNPFPNWKVLQPNLQFFKDNGCTMMFQQASGGSWSDMMELKQYLIAKLLWNPAVDVDSVMTDFLNGYYEEAGPVLKQYIQLMGDSLTASKQNLGIYGFPYDGIHSYLTPTLIGQYRQLFDEAEELVKNKPKVLARVQKARLPLDFAILDISLRDVDDEFTWLMQSGNKRIAREDMLAKLDTLVERSERLNASWTNEQGLTTRMYRDLVNDCIRKSLDPGLGWLKPVTLAQPASEKYKVGGAQALTDGKRGLPDYNFNWLGFEDAHMEATIDLEEAKPIELISADFLQFIQAWIFLPTQVSVSYSMDGKTFTGEKIMKAPEKPTKTGSFVSSFAFNLKNVKARYVKVKAKALLKCPDGHPGHGLPAWIFCDELVIK